MADSMNTQAIFSAMLEAKKPSAKKRRVAESRKATKCISKKCAIMKENEDDEMMDDIIDNIAVITDPEKTVSDLEQRADDIQDAIDDTPEGEAAFSDEYVGSKVYACPVCGESFFADDECKEGDPCPICQETPGGGFLLQGEVVAPEEDEPVEDEVTSEDEIPAEDNTAEAGDDIDTEDVPEADDAKDDDDDEQLKAESLRKRARRIARAKRECAEGSNDICVDIKVAVPPTEEDEPEYAEYELDDKSFNEALTGFVKENYGSSIRAARLTKATYVKANEALRLESKLILNNGKCATATFVVKEAKYNNNRSILVGREASNTFKIESKSNPFRFDVVRSNGVIRCEKFTYNYTTRHPKAGAVKVEGVVRTRNGRKRV